MKICVTERDIACSTMINSINPVERALKRQTGQTWHVQEDGTAREVNKPFRAVRLPDEALAQLQSYAQAHHCTPFEFEMTGV